MAVFTDAELAYLQGQHIARLATASAGGQPEWPFAAKEFHCWTQRQAR